MQRATRGTSGLPVVLAAVLLLLACTSCSNHGSEQAVGRPWPAASSSAPPCTVPERLRGQDVTRLPIADDQVALTFDAGANADGAASILGTLHDKGIRATFFLKGGFVRTYPRLSRRIARHDLVGNHTMAHQDLTTLTRAEIRAEVRRAQRVITTTTGQDPRRFFRFPYGARSPREIRIVNRLCYVPFRWTVDTLGWEGTSGGQSVGTVVARVLDAATPGMIVLMHLGSNPDDGTTLDADALPQVIDDLQARGYSFVRLSRVMNPAP